MQHDSDRETLEDMASEVREDIACIKENLEEISYEAREERNNINNMSAEILAEIQHSGTAGHDPQVT